MAPTAYACSHIWAVNCDGALRFTPTSEISWQSAPQLSSPVVALAASQLHAAIYAACRDGSLHVFNPVTADLVLTAPNPLHDIPLCILPMPMENALFVGLCDGSVVRMHLTSLAFDCMLGCGVEHSAAVNALEADDQFLYSGGEDAVILVWDLKEANAVREISMPTAPINSLLRIDACLWVGLHDGTVQVFDIIGDDANGIECISDKRPHAAQVHSLVRVGLNEVWSVHVAHRKELLAETQTSNVAVWDTRDFSYEMFKTLYPSDVTSATVVQRVPYEDIAVLTLTNSLRSHLTRKSVRGMLLPPCEEASETDDFLVSDFENQRDQIDCDVNASYSSQRLDKGHNIASDAEPSRTSYLVQITNSLDSLLEDSCGDEVYRVANFANEYPELDHQSPDAFEPLVITAPVSDMLKRSLAKISELVVSILADEVLAPQEGVPSENENLRKAVATITKELDTGKQLVDSCIIAGSEGSYALDENDPKLTWTSETNAAISPSVPQLRKRIDNEIEKSHRVEKNLQVVSTERDLFAQDLQQLQNQSEATMSSLESIIRDRNATIKAKDIEIGDLQRESDNLRIQLDGARQQVQDHIQLRDDLTKTLDEQLEKISRNAEDAAKAHDNELRGAYDKIETMSIEIQAQRDSHRTVEIQLEAAKATNQALERKCADLERDLEASHNYREEMEREVSAREALEQSGHQAELSSVRQDCEAEIAFLTQCKEQLEASSRNFDTQFADQEKAMQKTILSLQSEFEREKTELENSLSDAREKETAYATRVADLERNMRTLNTKMNSNRAELERVSDEKRHVETELRISKGANTLKNADRETLLEELRIEMQKLRDEKALLIEEIDHRKIAAGLYEAEAEDMRSIVSNLKLATEELQECLGNAEKEALDFQERNDFLSEALELKDHRIQELEMGHNTLGKAEKERDPDVDDDGKAAKAILASANGEIEQITNQLDAMHRAHLSQERELNELREALSARDESIRLKNATIASMMKAELRGEARENSDLYVNVTPGGLDVLDERSSELENASFKKQTGESILAWASGRRNSYQNEEVPILVSQTLQELQEGMTMTKDKLRDLSNTARRYKKLAQSHIDILPALHEVESELARICQKDWRKGIILTAARGILQSVIAQYYSSRERISVLQQYEEALYKPSEKRLEALQDAVSRLRDIRVGSEGPPSRPAVQEVVHNLTNLSVSRDKRVEDQSLHSPTRLLTF